MFILLNTVKFLVLITFPQMKSCFTTANPHVWVWLGLFWRRRNSSLFIRSSNVLFRWQVRGESSISCGCSEEQSPHDLVITEQLCGHFSLSSSIQEAVTGIHQLVLAVASRGTKSILLPMRRITDLSPLPAHSLLIPHWPLPLLCTQVEVRVASICSFHFIQDLAQGRAGLISGLKTMLKWRL